MPIATDTALVLARVPVPAVAPAVPVAMEVVRGAITDMVTAVTREVVTEMIRGAVTGVTRGVVMVGKGEKYTNSSNRELTGIWFSGCSSNRLPQRSLRVFS
jgi:hypothetical protein